MFTFTKKNFPGLPNLGTQIRGAQNRYTAVQIDLKYPLATFKIIRIAVSCNLFHGWMAHHIFSSE